MTLRTADTIQELLAVLGLDLSKALAEEDLPHELVDLARAQAGYEGDDAAEAADLLLAARQEARAQKDWPRADAIRDGIGALGLQIEDTANGARLRPAKKA